MTEGKRGSTYPALKRLGLSPGEAVRPGFQLPEHAQKNISPTQSAEMIADYFCQVSQEYSPLDVSSLPPSVQSHLSKKPGKETIPSLSVHDVYSKIAKAKKANSSVPRDLPKKIIQTFSADLFFPTTALFNM